MVYTTPTLVRQATNNKLTITQISNDDLIQIIKQATAEINSKINVKVREESVKYIDSTRKNRISDGTTTTFYVKNGILNYLADMDNDGSVTTSDVKVFKVDNNDIRTELTVSAIDIEDGSFTLSEAPGTDTKYLYVWYAYSFYDVNTPDKLIQLLATYLSASYAYLQKNHSLPSSTKFGNITISHSQVGSAQSRYFTRYKELLKQVIVPPNKPIFKQYKNLI